MMHWEDKPIGRQVRNGDRIAGNIVGVLKDFATSNAAYVAVQPMYATYLDRFSGNIQLRLKEPFDDNLKRLNEDMESCFPPVTLYFPRSKRSLTTRTVPSRISVMQLYWLP